MKLARAAYRFAGVLLAAGLVAGCAARADSVVPVADPVGRQALHAAQAFLNNYIDADGRVVRRDQGGDTVSEGQAYALLIASALHAQLLFDKVWDWTRRHLMQPNGLPAWRIDAGGGIPDTQSASDADVLMAWLLLRDDGPNRQEHQAAGRQLANAVLEHEVIFTATGGAMLAAGPWAVDKGVINVSYWSSAVFDDLARLTGNSKWAVMAEQVPTMLGELTLNGSLLPPDWAQLKDEALHPSSSPQGVASSPSTQPQYGFDAQRAVLWSAVSCSAQERRDAARWYALLQNPSRARSMSLALKGDVLNGSPHPVPLVAAAAAADAAGDDQASQSLMASAEDEYRQSPSFFGAAWIALGRLLLFTDSLTTCGE